MKYILTKQETIIRTEEVQYEIDIPRNIKNKSLYAANQVEENNYTAYGISEVVNSELVDEKVVHLRKKDKTGDNLG